MATEQEDSTANFGGDDPGLLCLDRFEELFSIDPEWLVRTDRGLEWWGSTLRQSVWADPVREIDGLQTCRVHVRTDLVRNIERRMPTELLNFDAMVASLYGLVEGERPDEISIQSSVNIHADAVEPCSRLLAAAASMQLGECQEVADRLVDYVGGEVACSEHPKSGLRKTPDDMVSVVDTLVATGGQARLRFEAEDVEMLTREFETAGVPVEVLEEGVGLRLDLSRAGCFADVVANDHPKHGCGVLVILFLYEPYDPHTDIMALNASEHAAHLPIHGVGSWALNGTQLAHPSFLPNAYLQPQMILDLAMSSLTRAMWIASRTVSEERGE